MKLYYKHNNMIIKRYYLKNKNKTIYIVVEQNLQTNNKRA